MNVAIEESWKKILHTEFEKEYFERLTRFVKTEYSKHRCFPGGSEIFASFNRCRFDDVKIVIIGQDPYHGPGQANGLCFSVHESVSHPPSLINIFKELQQDVGKPYPKSGDLGYWADQGVLLLNATLTVRASEAGSHQGKGWEKFTDAVIENLSENRENLVFMLWGGYAKKKGRKINHEKHLILNSGHPSPLSANRGYWFGNRHFSQANSYLKKLGKEEIRW
ncbi:uracil-DNA glycosylase [Lutimonas zeaxanthinifaciens]|uniref:uracil-DNA glycosylase n=1 Tax=Lutimonas zeaxanthinifaciens TaxID=3060215 RepID=UPI00265CFECA|nr:uracil-DNA glycosylase [Lutimonas sp. YSD2104]WKK65184.1 uracil-DNA glycosylase [Lutimonas sp. YSD2104]